MASQLDQPISPEQSKFVSTEAVVLGVFLSGVMAFYSLTQHPHLSSVAETLLTAIFLTALVAFIDFRLPTLFTSNPFMAAFTLMVVSGFISLLFDSFAVVLLVDTIVLTGVAFKTLYPYGFNKFAVRVTCAFNALTVGAGFYLGELYGLPYFISSGMDNPLAGLPILAAVGPYCFLMSYIIAKRYPVEVQPVRYTRMELLGGAELVTFLTLLIITHNVLLSMSVLMIWATVTGRILKLVERTLHELAEGGINAIGLVLIALFAEGIPLIAGFVDSYARGFGVTLFSAISSPLAGAMIPPAQNLSEFYWNLSLLMVGAPFAVFSSLVGIMVFNERLSFDDLPEAWKRFPGVERAGHMQEALAYTLFVTPMIVGLFVWMLPFHLLGIFPWLYELLVKAVGPTFGITL